MRLARSILGMASIVIQTGSNSVGLPKQRQGVRLDCPGLAHALLDVAGGARAGRAGVIGGVGGHLAGTQPPDVYGCLLRLGLERRHSLWRGASTPSVGGRR